VGARPRLTTGRKPIAPRGDAHRAEADRDLETTGVLAAFAPPARAFGTAIGAAFGEDGATVLEREDAWERLALAQRRSVSSSRDRAEP
jgi:hypothetical protein